eukprot:9388402-Ditylum_brightwellii.AAC.1
MPGMSSISRESVKYIIDKVLHYDESTCILLNNANIRDKSSCEVVKQKIAKNPLQHGKPKRDLDYQRKSPGLAVMPSPNVKSIQINYNPQIIQYNIHDPPHLIDNTLKMRKIMKTSQLKIMMMVIMKTQMMHHRIKTKIYHQFSKVE